MPHNYATTDGARSLVPTRKTTRKTTYWTMPPRDPSSPQSTSSYTSGATTTGNRPTTAANVVFFWPASNDQKRQSEITETTASEFTEIGPGTKAEKRHIIKHGNVMYQTCAGLEKAAAKLGKLKPGKLNHNERTIVDKVYGFLDDETIKEGMTDTQKGPDIAWYNVWTDPKVDQRTAPSRQTTAKFAKRFGDLYKDIDAGNISGHTNLSGLSKAMEMASRRVYAAKFAAAV